MGQIVVLHLDQHIPLFWEVVDTIPMWIDHEYWTAGPMKGSQHKRDDLPQWTCGHLHNANEFVYYQHTKFQGRNHYTKDYINHASPVATNLDFVFEL